MRDDESIRIQRTERRRTHPLSRARICLRRTWRWVQRLLWEQTWRRGMGRLL
jgi:hypothetical protein